MGRTYYEKLPLAEVVQTANVIVIGTIEGEEIEYEYSKKGFKVKNRKKRSKGVYVDVESYKFQVQKVLFGEDKVKSTDIEILMSADYTTELHVSEIFASGGSKSPIYNVFESDSQPSLEGGEKMIMFLRPCDFKGIKKKKNGFVVAVGKAYESMSALSKVEELIKPMK